MDLDLFSVIGFERPVVRLMKMDQDRHSLAWAELACTFSLVASFPLAGFPLWCKTEHEIIDSTKPFEYTHRKIPPVIERSCFSGSYSRSSERGLLIQNSR